jgi:two-component system, OmpR family, sensor histidine kinase MprB
VSLRTRLTVVAAAAVAVAIALASVAVFIAARSVLRGEIDDGLRERAAEARLVAGPGGFVVRLPNLPFGGSGGFAQLIAADEQADLPGSRLPVTAEARAVAAGQRDAYFEDRTVSGVHLRILTQQIAPGFAVQVARSLEEIDQTLGRLALILVGLSILGMALAAGLGRVVAQAALSPVRDLSAATDHVARTQDLSRRVEAPGTDELGRLATSFNAMLDALAGSLAAQRQLVADASHELRTPLTSLRTNVEVLARAHDLPPEERERLLVDVVAQLEELTALVADVVELARGAGPDEQVEELSLDAVVADAVERAERHAPDVRFEADLEPSVVRGVAPRLARAIGNLLDNAAKWSEPGGSVEVRVRAGEVTVRDHGPGIAPEDLPHVFERFYRAPAARSRPGSGLGLAIVRQVAEAHGGTVVAERAEGGGALLVLRLPENGSPTS